MDKYDKAIAYLTEHPTRIYDAWIYADSNVAGCLFNFCNPTGAVGLEGCLTMIRDRPVPDSRSVLPVDIHKAIFADKRIPANRVSDIKLKDLPVFAEWQRKLDELWPGRSEKIEAIRNGG